MISNTELALRLGLGFLAGTIIGFERSRKHQVAGLRTHILICTGATLLTLVSIQLPVEMNPLKSGDPGRIAAQIVTGIGFLGAGAIIRLGNNIKGLTTAASLWFTGAVGMSIGAGMYLAAAIAEGAAILTLVVMDAFERRFIPAQRNKIMEIWYKDSIPDTTNTMNILKSFGVRIQTMNMEQIIGKSKGTRLKMLVGIPETLDLTKITKALKDTRQIERLIVNEKY